MDKYDFSGWATRNDLQCSDGRIIRKDAFAHNDGMTVPLVWNHVHSDLERVIGHALLENRDEGVYAYGKFNDTNLGQTAKLCVQHGDITALSIYANQLKQQGPNVMHGNIRELSLVLAGANPGAYIENVLKHGDEPDSEEARIFTGLDIELYHVDNEKKEEKGEEKVAEETKKTKNTEESENKEETIGDILETLSEKQKKAVYALIGSITKDSDSDEKDEKEVKHADTEDNSDNETVQDVYKTLSEKQKMAVDAIIGEIVGEDEEDNEEIEHSEGGNTTMKHNVFENEEMMNETLSHSEMVAILEDAKRVGSLREAVLQHGITDIDVMFPDATAIDKEPGFIKRNDTWVTDVLGGVHHTPFSRIKSIFADITADEARAKGYTKGKLKIDEVFKMLKRVTNPTTIYKKQKLDRDDMLDIKEFSIVAWLKSELRMMLDEELARSILVGDGRTSLAEDKIKEDCIRPIWTDDDLYTVKSTVEVDNTATADAKARAFIKACVKSRKNYMGSGNPVMFMSEDMLTDCLLIEDTNQRVIYDTVQKLAAALRVSKIIPVPVMEGLTRDVEGVTHTLAGIYVNLADYNVGTDKGGEVTMFDDFDIDYNQQKYLMETRCSGALTKPFSAVAIEFVPTAG